MKKIDPEWHTPDQQAFDDLDQALCFYFGVPIKIKASYLIARLLDIIWFLFRRIIVDYDYIEDTKPSSHLIDKQS